MVFTQYQIVSGHAVTLLTGRGEHLSPGEAEAAVRRALRVCGYAPWEHMCIDVFEGVGGELLIASPGSPGQIHMVGELLPFLQEYFTD